MIQTHSRLAELAEAARRDGTSVYALLNAKLDRPAPGADPKLTAEPEAVLLGAALLGAVASGRYASVVAGMAGMSGAGASVLPRGGDVGAYPRAKHSVFLRMYDDQIAYRALMAGA